MPPTVLWKAISGSLQVQCPLCGAQRRPEGVRPDERGYMPMGECRFEGCPPVTVKLSNWRPWGAR